MAQKYSVYVTYFLQNDTNVGYTDAVHCNYIQKFEFDTLVNQEVNIFFEEPNDFNFLNPDNPLGVGIEVNKICMMVQVVTNKLISRSPDVYEEVKSQSHLWKCFDVTDQIVDHTLGDPLTSSGLTSGVFKVAVSDYYSTGSTYYTLDYLNYPKNNESDELGFGDEEIFLGNVDTDIEASVYTTDLIITLPLNEFNSSTNPTWDGKADDGSVYISEIGIYNEEKELVGIGKFNNPLKKNNQISRAIAFEIDF